MNGSVSKELLRTIVVRNSAIIFVSFFVPKQNGFKGEIILAFVTTGNEIYFDLCK